MIQIVSSPTYKRTYPTPDGGTTTFDFNVVGVLSTISYMFRSVQAQMMSITRNEVWALLTLRGNINDYLAQVQTVTGKPIMVYVDDNTDDGYNYTGTYVVDSLTVDGDGNSQLRLKVSGSETPTYYGDKTFPADNTSQLVYQYRTRMTYEVYDVTPINGISRNVLLATRRQQLSASGYNAFNISELAKGYVSPTGGVALRVVVTSADYFDNTDTVTTDPCILVQARVPEINYGLYTLFNPETGGEILPTTGYQLLYNDTVVYPFYVNFVTNSLIGSAGATVQMKVDLFQRYTLQDTHFIDIPGIVGLNTIDLSTIPAIAESIIERQPTAIRIEINYMSTDLGEFTDEFNDEFVKSQGDVPAQSRPYNVTCHRYTLDNRRDFYFAYQNGIGGLSTYLCNEYRRVTEPEIVALRNASTISNSVARETESVELTFKYADLKGVYFLLGYRIDGMLKYDGVYESQNVQRIGAGGSRLQWIVRSSSYDLPNSTLYKDITFTVYRPIGMVPENDNLE